MLWDVQCISGHTRKASLCLTLLEVLVVPLGCDEKQSRSSSFFILSWRRGESTSHFHGCARPLLELCACLCSQIVPIKSGPECINTLKGKQALPCCFMSCQNSCSLVFYHCSAEVLFVILVPLTHMHVNAVQFKNTWLNPTIPSLSFLLKKKMFFKMHLNLLISLCVSFCRMMMPGRSECSQHALSLVCAGT